MVSYIYFHWIHPQWLLPQRRHPRQHPPQIQGRSQWYLLVTHTGDSYIHQYPYPGFQPMPPYLWHPTCATTMKTFLTTGPAFIAGFERERRRSEPRSVVVVVVAALVENPGRPLRSVLCGASRGHRPNHGDGTTTAVGGATTNHPPRIAATIAADSSTILGLSRDGSRGSQSHRSIVVRVLLMLLLVQTAHDTHRHSHLPGTREEGTNHRRGLDRVSTLSR